jgi:very-short-patch-repair endonuclease
MNQRLNNLIGLKSKRIKLRKNLTPAEARLWLHLKNSQQGQKFRRQHSFDYYILDFYCPAKKLAVELDGSPHDTNEGYAKDKARTDYLESKGLKIIRFENKDVISNLEGILAEIRKHVS